MAASDFSAFLAASGLPGSAGLAGPGFASLGVSANAAPIVRKNDIAIVASFFISSLSFSLELASSAKLAFQAKFEICKATQVIRQELRSDWARMQPPQNLESDVGPLDAKYRPKPGYNAQ